MTGINVYISFKKYILTRIEKKSKNHRGTILDLSQIVKKKYMYPTEEAQLKNKRGEGSAVSFSVKKI